MYKFQWKSNATKNHIQKWNKDEFENIFMPTNNWKSTLKSSRRK